MSEKKKKFFRLVSDTDTSHFDIDEIQMKMGDGEELVAAIVKRKGMNDFTRPVIIFLPGSGGDEESMQLLSFPLALRGYITVTVDMRDLDFKQDKNEISDWRPDDLKDIIDILQEQQGITSDDFCVLGHSKGAVFMLDAGLSLPRVKLMIGISLICSLEDLFNNDDAKKWFTQTWFIKKMLMPLVFTFDKLRSLDSKISPLTLLNQVPKQQIYNRLRLIHARDDEIVKYEYSFEKLQGEFDFPKHNYFILDHGGHSLKGQEGLILVKILEWLEEKFGPLELPKEI